MSKNTIKKVASASLSRFVRLASSGENKKIYRKIIDAASNTQDTTIEKLENTPKISNQKAVQI